MTNLRLLLLAIFLPFCAQGEDSSLWAPENIDAWCIVPFDAKQRTPKERAEMIVRLGLKRVAYDWRDQHVPEFEDEILQYQKHGIEMFAFWGGHEKAFELFKKYQLHPQIWIIAPAPQAPTNDQRIKLAAEQLLPLVERTKQLACPLALYNHGGWSGEPENMAGIVEYLRTHHDATHVGIVYNFHHGHAHIEGFAEKWQRMQAYLLAVNLNGMEINGDAKGRKILYLGEGDQELPMMRIIEESGWFGPVGVLDHREDSDSEISVRNNLRGLAWLRKELAKPGSGGPRPRPASAVPVKSAKLVPGRFGMALDAAQGGLLLEGSDEWRSAPITVEAWAKLRNPAAFNVVVASDCKTSGEHWELYSYAGAGDFSVYLPAKGGEVRSGVGICDDAWHHLAMVLERERVRLYVDGKLVVEKALQTANNPAVPSELGIGRTVDPGIGCNGLIDDVRISRGVREITVPDAAMTRDDRTLKLFSCDALPPSAAAALSDLEPLDPAAHPLHTHPVNRERLYDFYAKQARNRPADPDALIPAYPGLDGGTAGHWGNQNEDTWRDGRWNQMDCGSALSGVFHGPGLTVPKAVCVRLGENGERSACYDPETDQWRALWLGGFVKFSNVRHGLMDGLAMDGELLDDGFTKPRPRVSRTYRGFYRYEKRTLFAFERDGMQELMEATFEDGSVRLEEGDSLRAFTTGGPAQWPQILETRGTSSEPVSGWPYVVDTLTLPFDNPWHTLFFLGGHDFFSNGDIALCTMTGDVWRVSGVDSSLSTLHWKRMAAGLHQPLGLVIVDDLVHIMGRDQITRLHDLNGDGEADFYECLTNDFATPTGGHDYLCGLERDTAGNFYTVSGKSGLIRLAPDKVAETLASGFRNPDGLGLAPDGTLTVPVSEGEWTPASAIYQITTGGYYGYPGPRTGVETLPPLLYLPRGIDNSAGGQAWVHDDRWGPLRGQMIHLSYGTGTHLLVLRKEVNGIWQGAAVTLPGDFNSGAHRARFSPRDGQLYVSGMTGWGTYTPDDGCLQRVRYTSGPVQLPVAFEARDNGILLTFAKKVDPSATDPARHFAQCWNYRYSQAYGSQEYSLRHPETVGHDALKITSAHRIGGGHQLFLEIPQLQPANQIHLVVEPGSGVRSELFLTAHQLAPAFTDYPGYTVVAKTRFTPTTRAILALRPSPYAEGTPGRALRVETTVGLQFATKKLSANAGERLSLTLANPDALPHNWVLLASDSLAKVGDLANKLIADPAGVTNHYVPDVPDVLAWTEMIAPGAETTIHFNAPSKPGTYPYICTFPGHWMVMKGVLTVNSTDSPRPPQ
jgi:azurin